MSTSSQNPTHSLSHRLLSLTNIRLASSFPSAAPDVIQYLIRESSDLFYRGDATEGRVCARARARVCVCVCSNACMTLRLYPGGNEVVRCMQDLIHLHYPIHFQAVPVTSAPP